MSLCTKRRETAAIRWSPYRRCGRTQWRRPTYKAMGIWDLHGEVRRVDDKERLDEWPQAARRTARGAGAKYAISNLVGEAAKRGAETVASGAERLRAEAERLTDDEEVGETARRAASHVKKAGQTVRDVAGDTGKKVFDDARTYY